MSQHDYDIANADGATVRADLNSLFEAIATRNSGSTAPSTTFAYQPWFDTANNLLKMRNGANNAWVTVASLVGTTWIPYRSGSALGALAVLSSVDTAQITDNAVTLGTLAITAKESPIILACSDETSDLTTGTAKVTFRMPYAFTVTDVRANVNTAPTGSTIIVDINESGTTILSTKLSIDAGEETSESAATPPVISDASLADDAEITIDIDQIGSSTAGKGLKVALIGYRTS